MIRSVVNVLLLVSLCWISPVSSLNPLQPTVTTVEHVSRRVFGSISFPFGHPWCDGKPTYWLVGHEASMEAPHCLVTNHTGSFENFNFTGSIWKENTDMKLQSGLDRHDCAAFDINLDNVADIVCGIGVAKGTQTSEIEIYTTRHKHGTKLHKATRGRGLWKYKTMRHRIMTTLKAADNSTLLAMATKGDRRKDGKPNNHRIFKLVHAKGSFKFQELPGPRVWSKYTDATCFIVADVNQDGLDDLVLCSKKVRGAIFTQNDDGSFQNVKVPLSAPNAFDWRDARVVDVSGDGINDLIVVGSGGQEPHETSYVRVFAGTAQYPYFDYTDAGVYYYQELPYASPSLEIIDANGDGRPDVYVVQVDEATPGSYCNGKFNKRLWWGNGNTPPDSFIPPLDQAPDILLMNLGSASFSKFSSVLMDHREPGCGYFVEHFGSNSTIILGQGNNRRPGHNLILQWGV